MRKAAIYTRVSTAMQAEKDYNSCEAQKDKMLSFIKSQDNLEFVKEYSDPGFTGSNLDRPGMKEMLRDIAARKIDVVLAYKIDRLTRSSKDFYSLIEFFEKYGTSFVSVSECFDTSSASGRLLRNIMLTFAQFERELTAERTRDKMLQRAEKGLWNGQAPFGYRLEEKKLVIDKKKAEIVREIFETFMTTGSLLETMKRVNENGWKSRSADKPLTINGVFYMLRNPVYTGKMNWAKKVYPASHEPIISQELFDHAQSLKKEKTIKKKLYKEYFLRGLLKCAECGSVMTPHFVNKKARRYYYYKCYGVVRHGKSACSIKEVNAEKLESFLAENLSRMSRDEQYIENLVFKTLHRRGYPSGFELPEEAEKNTATRVSQVLKNFKIQVDRGSQVERCLAFQKTISAVSFAKETMEVVLKLEDTIKLDEGRLDGSLVGAAGVKSRAGAVNLPAPACDLGSNYRKSDPSGYPKACFYGTGRQFKPPEPSTIVLS